ncbi:MAG: DUF177 domain-containing protein [Tissierellales bacterium]|nr:DUF177 domain-containing protein [Tissierellales bacterium]MBN2827710.1 DUF177 domain-containing protein [Tissierellales bacterium]
MILDLKKFLKNDAIHENFNISFNPDHLNLDSSILLSRDVTGEVDVYKTDDRIYADLKFSYYYIEFCARCLEKFENEVQTEASVTIVPVGQVNRDEDEDGFWVELVDNQVDFSEVVIQSIYLSHPMKALCKEDCKGICPVCGINKNKESCNCVIEKIDPRLSNLANLLDKEV